MSKQPKLEIAKESLDKGIELAALILLLANISIVLWFYKDLPGMVPSHYGFDGEPSTYTGKNVLFILPVIGIAIYTLFYYVKKVPHQYNFPGKITQENAAENYRHALRSMRLLELICISTFFYITYQTIQIGLSKADNLGYLFVLVFLITIFAVILYMTLGFKK